MRLFPLAELSHRPVSFRFFDFPFLFCSAERRLFPLLPIALVIRHVLSRVRLVRSHIKPALTMSSANRGPVSSAARVTFPGERESADFLVARGSQRGESEGRGGDSDKEPRLFSRLLSRGNHSHNIANLSQGESIR